MTCIIDFQANIYKYKRTSNYIIREFAILDLDVDSHQSWLFQFPKWASTNKTNIWLEEKYHGIKPYDGDIPYNHSIIRKYTSDYDQIYCKGLEKSLYLQKILGKTVTDLDDCPSLKLLNSNCSCFLNAHKNEKYVCAVRNCAKVKKWLMYTKNINSISFTFQNN